MSKYLSNVYSIGDILRFHKINLAVASPGSRCAPLIMGLQQEPSIHLKIIRDERCAGFIAMGMAEQVKKVVLLLSTSGTATLNLAPAIAESYYRSIPLLILTADRPAEWIGQEDGQSLIQKNIYQNFSKASFELLADYENPYSFWYLQRTFNEAIIKANTYPKGPVHINMPFREPLYPNNIIKTKPYTYFKNCTTEAHFDEKKMIHFLKKHQKIVIVAGQATYSKKVKKILNKLNIPIISDCTSNLFSLKNAIVSHDLFLSHTEDKKELQPDTLISIGGSVLSKSLKQFLRQHKPLQHLKVDTDETIKDTFQCLTRIVKTQTKCFFTKKIIETLIENQDEKYTQTWKRYEEKTHLLQKSFLEKLPFCELFVVKEILDAMDENTNCFLHISNSMPVRYVNVLQRFLKNTNCIVFSNRGVSGIDGCMSTAVGHSMANEKVLHILMIGDISFFYDSNALWNENLPKNLHILLLNNRGGGIFRYITPASQLQSLESSFETQHSFKAKYLAKTFHIPYFYADDKTSFQKHIKTFFKEKKLKIFEIHTKPQTNQTTWNHMQQLIG